LCNASVLLEVKFSRIMVKVFLIDAPISANKAELATRLFLGAGSHAASDTLPKMPSGFHATAKGPLKLAGGDTFFARARQMDGLTPEP